MDVSALVRAVVSAFEDASKLVQRIRDSRKDNHAQLPEEPTQDLLDSLALGPVIVRGQYKHDLKRFAEPYSCGDIQARDQMKDVLINLQMSVIVILKAFVDGASLDLDALQAVSDDCRVNAGVCLGQLSQRLSDAAKAQAYQPQSAPSSAVSSVFSPFSSSFGYSSNRSTQSSTNFSVPPIPEVLPEEFSNLSKSTPFFRQAHDGRTASVASATSQPQQPRPPSTAVNTASSTSPVDALAIPDVDEKKSRRRSSQVLSPQENILLMFPQPGRPTNAPGPADEREREPESPVSPMSSGPESRRNSSSDVSRPPSIRRSQPLMDQHSSQVSKERLDSTEEKPDNGTGLLPSPSEPVRRTSTTFPSTHAPDQRSSEPVLMQKQPDYDESPLSGLSRQASSQEDVAQRRTFNREPQAEPVSSDTLRDSRSDSLGAPRIMDRTIPRRPSRQHLADQMLITERSRPRIVMPTQREPSRTPPPSAPPPTKALPRVPPALSAPNDMKRHASPSPAPLRRNVEPQRHESPVSALPIQHEIPPRGVPQPSQRDGPTFSARPSQREGPTYSALPPQRAGPTYSTHPPLRESSNNAPRPPSQRDNPTYSPFPTLSEDGARPPSQRETPTYTALPPLHETSDHIGAAPPQRPTASYSTMPPVRKNSVSARPPSNRDSVIHSPPPSQRDGSVYSQGHSQREPSIHSIASSAASSKASKKAVEKAQKAARKDAQKKAAKQPKNVAAALESLGFG